MRAPPASGALSTNPQHVSVESEQSRGTLPRGSWAERAKHIRPARLDPIPRWLDPVVAEVNLGLAPMVGDVNVHSQQDVAAWKMPVGRIMRCSQLRLGQVAHHRRAVLERIGEKL